MGALRLRLARLLGRRGRSGGRRGGRRGRRQGGLGAVEGREGAGVAGAVLRHHTVGAGDQGHEGAQVAAAHLDQVVALLAEGAGHRPAPVGGDGDHGDPDAEILGVADHLGQVFVAADHDRVGHGVVAGQGHQVAVDLGVDALAAARPDAGQAELQAGDVGQHVVFGGAAALDRGLVPVAAQQGRPVRSRARLVRSWSRPG